MKRKKLNYGLDAPAICFGMFGIASAGIIIGLISLFLFTDNSLIFVEFIAILIAAYGLWMGIYMVWSSRVGKINTCDELMGNINTVRKWNGDENVLDVGCGRGLLLIGAAKRLKSGRATGIDIWNNNDQLNNSPDGVIVNAEIEGVLDRIEIKTGDARQIPFNDEIFDVVVSHWVIHNIEDQEERSVALREIWRVLKRDGVLALADISFVENYMNEINGWNPKSIHFNNGGILARVMNILSGGTFKPQYLIVQK